MSTVQEIEAAIAKLSHDEFLRLHDRIQKRFDDDWDSQIEEDARAGRLDSIAGQALAEHRAGLSKPFPPHAE